MDEELFSRGKVDDEVPEVNEIPQSEIDAAVILLGKLQANNMEEYQSARCKHLRKAMTPFLSALQVSLYRGGTKEQHDRERAERFEFSSTI
jgi:hypothetical protein